MSYKTGRHLLQIPGPTNVPARVLRALSRTTFDHRGPDFSALCLRVLPQLKKVFKNDSGPVVVFASSGTGACEAALVNTLSPGDRVLMFETGQFAVQWRNVALGLGLEVDFLPGDWRHGVDPGAVKKALEADRGQAIKAVCVLHSETSTAVLSRLPEIRQAMNQAGHPALFLVDTISSLVINDFRQDEWGVDVAVCGSQKGLMLPPGLSFNSLSPKALEAGQKARMPKFYWAWEPMLKDNQIGFYPYTPATNLFFGLEESLKRLFEEGLENVLARHARLAEACRRAVRAWGLEIVAKDPAEYANGLTAVLLPEGFNSDQFRQVVLDKFNIALGTAFGPLRGKAFRIGHMGDFNESMLLGVLGGVEMSFKLFGVPFRKGGLAAAMDYLMEGE